MKTDNLFHSAGPANAKAQFPNFLIIIDRVTNVNVILLGVSYPVLRASLLGPTIL